MMIKLYDIKQDMVRGGSSEYPILEYLSKHETPHTVNNLFVLHVQVTAAVMALLVGKQISKC